MEKDLRQNLDWQSGDFTIPDPDEDKVEWNKVYDVEYGDWVKIIWQDEYGAMMVDYGYVLGWPSHENGDANMGGVIHIPRPVNPGGKGEPEQEWITLYELRKNPLVKKVKLVKPFWRPRPTLADIR